MGWRDNGHTSSTELNELINIVPYGMLVTLDELIDKHGTDMYCPMTAGIFVNISATAAEEDKLDGLQETTLYWRALKKDGEVNPKFPGGVRQQIHLL